ncbi:GNAT family N-acetyltransferase [Hahella sp. CCB-MM4]|uniref:GNAT family N-acetyltransferase n=1 Tax=Hahella sp. (strain CCB-MM4) TaxID=1926491 RepID=UPI000B9BB6D2|nr:GNAT family N-acetyltransferase [Hahella sp. CCB-MM4]OZG71582.1 GNAT family N-acetyltransferase [Hahella sp. CCB-MM4]
MKVEIVVADYLNPTHSRDIGFLMDCYARDPMGGGEPLSEDIRQRLAVELAKIPNAFSLLCYVDDQPAGLVNCFQGFSTFKCRPLINIHDIVVASDFRGLGLSRKLLQKVQSIAQKRGCCKLTLEVLEGNAKAQRVYSSFGFSGYELGPKHGRAMFWEKPL